MILPHILHRDRAVTLTSACAFRLFVKFVYLKRSLIISFNRQSNYCLEADKVICFVSANLSVIVG